MSFRVGRSRSSSRQGSDSPLHLRVLCTPSRCHIASGLISLGLLLLIVWMWTHPETIAADRIHQPEQIQDAVTLISSCDQMQNQFELASKRRQKNHDRIEQIAKWLPANPAWDRIRSQFQSIAAANEVQLISLERGSQHEGTRVAVLDARCEIRGSYASICQFLGQVIEVEQPIWCSEIRVVRTNDSTDVPGPDRSSNHPRTCLATISLRIPYAGKDTTAAKLLQRRSSDET